VESTPKLRLRCEGTLADFKDHYAMLESCCLRAEAPPLVNASTKLIAFVRSVAGEVQPDGAAVTRLSDGTYAVFQEWEDYSGHG